MSNCKRLFIFLVFILNSEASFAQALTSLNSLVATDASCLITITCDTTAGSFSYGNFFGYNFAVQGALSFSGVCSIYTNYGTCTGYAIGATSASSAMNFHVMPYEVTSAPCGSYGGCGNETTAASEAHQVARLNQCLKSAQTAHALGKKVTVFGIARRYLNGWWPGIVARQCAVSD